jgi:alginate O-acetyltransferase complex protein AlgJ
LSVSAKSDTQIAETAQRAPAAGRRPALGRVFLLAFAALLIVPLASALYRPGFKFVRPVDEHRAPATFPSPSLLRKAGGDFAAQINSWFDDRVGLRDLFIRTKNQIDYSVFHTSRKVYVGPNGWLFERGTTENRLALQRADADELRSLEHAFLNLAHRLQQKGIRLIVVGYPDKSMLYPELLPAQAPHIPRGGNYDQLRAFLATQPDLNFIDAEKLLDREKSQTTEPLFYKTDIHVNVFGSVPIVHAIVDRIADMEGRPENHWHEKFEVGHADWPVGSEGRFLSLLWPVSEQIAHITPQYEIGRDEADGHWNIPDRRAVGQVGSQNVSPFDFEFRSLPQLCSQRLPGLAVFGNSFSDPYWAIGLQRHFCFVRRSRTPIERLTPYVASLPQGTKYFVFQYLAAYLPGEGPWLKAE